MSKTIPYRTVRISKATSGAIASTQDFRLLWFRADNDLFVHNGWEQMKTTLLGLRIFSVKRNGQELERLCCYAAQADFFRYRDIDGAMIEVDGERILIPNQFSSRQASFINSPIYMAIAPAIMDVRQADSKDAIYVIDGDINRKNDEASLDCLRKKYPNDEFLAFR